jgi:hypothetical protein
MQRNFEEVKELQVLADKTPVRHDFEAPFIVEITKFDDWVIAKPQCQMH